MSRSHPSKREYRARCHCGAIRSSFVAEEITSGERCNCSMCSRKGAVVSTQYIPAADFVSHEDMSLLSDCRWATTT